MENLTVANTFDYPNEEIHGKQAVALLTKADRLTVNGVFARETGEGLTYKESWDALAAYAQMAKDYVAAGEAVVVDLTKEETTSIHDTLTQNQVALGDKVHKVYYDVNPVDASGNIVKLETGKIRLVFGYPDGIDYTQYDFNVYHIKDSGDIENLNIEITYTFRAADTTNAIPFIFAELLAAAFAGHEKCGHSRQH